MGPPSEREDRENKEIKPYTSVERPACPFYGFDATFDALVMKDSGGNQCALKTDLYSPCQMEMVGDKPSWSGCPFNTEKNRKKIEGSLEQIRVFPREFRPSEAKPWEGISLGDWMIYSQQC